MKNIKQIPNITNYLVFAIILIIWCIFSILTKGVYFSPRNISNIFLQMTIIAYISMGMAFVIISGNIDLSVGSLVGLTGAVVASLQVNQLLKNTGINQTTLTMLTIVTTLIVGALIGLWQGLWISYGKIPSVIVTLGGMLSFRGIVLLITKGITVRPMLMSLKYLGQGYLSKTTSYIISVIAIIILWIYYYFKFKINRIVNKPLRSRIKEIIVYSLLSIFIILFTLIFNLYRGFPIPVVLMFTIGIILTFISKYTQLGRYTYAIGGNKEASRLLGINTKKYQLFIFMIMGILASISGIIMTARVDAGTTYAGQFYEIEAISACAIGGISLLGGRGSIFGAIIGTLILYSIDNGMSMLNIQISWQFIIKGMIIILIVWTDINFRKK